MAILIGVGLALAIGGMARWMKLDRDRAFYATVVMVVASYYVLFAIMGNSAALLPETLICLGFVVLSLVGFKTSPWIVAAALAGHGIFDLFHPRLVNNAGVPPWWPNFCASYDVTAGALLALLLLRAKSQPAIGDKR